ncbi:MAG TPA: D-aminoacylase [Phnomibacter sp.]|nr:D-aminoacylase [Phnomibacter sp.]
MRYCCFFLLVLSCIGCTTATSYDTIIRNGLVYDGNGGNPIKADIAINADTIAFIGDLGNAVAKQEIDVNGMAVAPGFINMLSWATVTLLQDGNSQSDIRQGVTTEIMGEGESCGPLNERMKANWQKSQGDFKFEISWNTLGEYLQHIEKKGISCNVASFVGATTVRNYVLGEDNIAPTPAQLDSMQALVKQAMEEGALGVGSSLIYPPAFFAKTDELTALCKTAAPYGGMYISHMRSEGNNLLEALEELITISKDAGIPAEVYHLKAAGQNNWAKLDSAIRRIERARAEGMAITANMYNYEAGATSLTASFPPTLQDGGFGKLHEKLKQPAVRAALKKEMQTNATNWENLYYAAGSPKNILLIEFSNDSLRKYNGMSLASIATQRGQSPEECAMDLVIEDSSNIGAVYFLMQEDNIKKQIALPWMSFCSDAGSYTNEGNFLRSSVHPRAYGNFARLLGKYVRDEKIIPLQEAIRKLTKLPATNLKLQKRGELKVGNYADIVVFDAARITDVATFGNPHQYAKGMLHVWVNGQQVLNAGAHTNAKPGKFLKGPGYKKS